MAAARALSLLLTATAGLVFGACGSGQTGGSAPAGNLIIPPIQAISRTVPASTFGHNVAFIRSGCLEVPLGPGVGPRPPQRSCQPGRAAIDGRAQTPGTPVHLEARLPLKRPASLSQEAFFAVYHSQGSGTCFAVVYAIAIDPLVCHGSVKRCPALCVRSFAEGKKNASLGRPATGIYVLVAGTVPSMAHVLRLHFPGGTTLTYALRGPLARGMPGRRIFMADVGRRPKPSRVEIVR
jgi:hypothetical protein